MLEINGLNVFYGDYQALFDIKATVASGEIVALLGANGAGKTTTINTVCGFVRPRTGTIRFEGNEIHQLSANKIVEKGLIQIPEERMLFPEMTVLENLQMGAYLGRARENLADSLDWVYGLFPILKERAGQESETLSGGEQQMLAMARAMLRRPKLLMLDEPSLGLAPQIARQVYDALLKISQAGTTILLVEQNAKLALGIATFGYIMESGRIVLEGTPQELQANEDVQELYLGVGKETTSYKDWRLYKKRRTW